MQPVHHPVATDQTSDVGSERGAIVRIVERVDELRMIATGMISEIVEDRNCPSSQLAQEPGVGLLGKWTRAAQEHPHEKLPRQILRRHFKEALLEGVVVELRYPLEEGPEREPLSGAFYSLAAEDTHEVLELPMIESQLRRDAP